MKNYFSEAVIISLLIGTRLSSSPITTIFAPRLWLSLFLFFKGIYLLAVSHGMWDLSSLIRDQTHTLCIGSVEF